MHQSRSFTYLSWKPKSATSDECVFHPFPLLAILVALVVLVIGDQLVQFWVTSLLKDAAGNSLLITVVPHHHYLCQQLGHHLSPGRCGSAVQLLSDTPSCSSEQPCHLSSSTFQNDKVEEIVKLL